MDTISSMSNLCHFALPVPPHIHPERQPDDGGLSHITAGAGSASYSISAGQGASAGMPHFPTTGRPASSLYHVTFEDGSTLYIVSECEESARIMAKFMAWVVSDRWWGVDAVRKECAT